MKVKRMGKTMILRRIWLFSANKIKSSESGSKQPTQLIVELNSSFRHTIVTKVLVILTKKISFQLKSPTLECTKCLQCPALHTWITNLSTDPWWSAAIPMRIITKWSWQKMVRLAICPCGIPKDLPCHTDTRPKIPPCRPVKMTV